MQYDFSMSEAARIIYNKNYPAEEWMLVPFEEAEHHRTVHYRNAVNAALSTRPYLAGDVAHQFALELS